MRLLTEFTPRVLGIGVYFLTLICCFCSLVTAQQLLAVFSDKSFYSVWTTDLVMAHLNECFSGGMMWFKCALLVVFCQSDTCKLSKNFHSHLEYIRSAATNPEKAMLPRLKCSAQRIPGTGSGGLPFVSAESVGHNWNGLSSSSYKLMFQLVSWVGGFHSEWWLLLKTGISPIAPDARVYCSLSSGYILFSPLA